MKTHAKQPAQRRCATPPQVLPIAAACAGAVLLMGAAHAQQAPQQLETVVVTGIRSAIESSISVKRNADSIVEAVTAEDLGKLPDLSIAESLARLPGLAAQRVNGNAQVLSIRGMSPKYGVTLLNGREMVSSGSDRSVEFDQFPAELMGGATVYKTPDAALGAQGLSGTVNMQSIRPLNFRGRQGNLNARMEKNSNGEQIPGLSSQGKRLSASYVDQFADRTIGVALGYAHLDSPEQQQHYANWWWANTANTKSYPPDWCGGDCGLKGVDRDAVSLQGFEATAFSTNQVRNGLMGVFEYKPNDQLHTVLDLYYSNFSKKFVGREFQGEMNTWNGVTYHGTSYENFGGEKVTVGGAIDNIAGKLLSRRNQRDDTIKAIGLNNELKLGGWTTVADLSYSKADRDETTAEMYAGSSLPSGFTSTAISMTGFSQFVPSINWADPAVMSLQQFWGQMGAARHFKVSDELKSLRLSAKRELDWGAVHQFEGGFNYSERSKDYRAVKEAYDLKSGKTNLAFPNGILMAPATLGFGSIPAVANFDVQALLDTGLFSARADDLSSAPNREWGVREKVSTAFGKFSLEFNAGVPVRGNIGLQVVHAKQEGHGLAWIDNSTQPVSGGKSYTDVLPSLNLAADLGSNTMLRFGAARVLARPNMEDMRAGVTNISRATTGKGEWSASGGNPTLDPWRADAVDLALEKYYGKRSYISLAGFYKELKTTVYKQDILGYDFSGYPDPLKGDPRYPILTYTGKLNAMANGDGGYVRGTEFSAAIDGAKLSPMLDGFGAILSASFTKSSIHQNNDLSNPLEGLSGTVASWVLYYEKSGLQARVAQRYRSRYMAAVRNAWGDTSYTTIEPEHITDLQLGYGWDSGPLKGVSVLFQVNNVTNEAYRTMMTVSDNSGTVPNLLYPGTYEKYGRQYLLGVNYKF